jgi:uncharacterized protein YicC (UPF0701 family)
MKTSSLDLLEKSQLPPAQARAILRVMESELSLHDTALATKSDLFATRVELREEIHNLDLRLEALRAELIGEIKGTIRWNFAFWIAQLAAIAGILKLLK